jgi:hypothetical protein
MKKKGKIRFLAEDEIELEQIKSDLKVIRLALLQEILKQAKSMDPDPNMIARLSSIYLKVSARLEKMIRDVPEEEIQDEIENDPVYKMGIPNPGVVVDEEYPPSLRNNGPANERRCAAGAALQKKTATVQNQKYPSERDNVPPAESGG